MVEKLQAIRAVEVKNKQIFTDQRQELLAAREELQKLSALLKEKEEALVTFQEALQKCNQEMEKERALLHEKTQRLGEVEIRVAQQANEGASTEDIEQLKEAIELLTKQGNEQPQSTPNEMFSKLVNALKRAKYVVEMLHSQQVVLQKRKRVI